MSNAEYWFCTCTYLYKNEDVAFIYEYMKVAWFYNKRLPDVLCYDWETPALLLFSDCCIGIVLYIELVVSLNDILQVLIERVCEHTIITQLSPELISLI